MTFNSTLSGKISRFQALVLLFMIQVVVLGIMTLLIPSDPTYAIFLGFTWARLGILAVFFAIIFGLIIVFFYHAKVDTALHRFFYSAGFIRVQSWVILVTGALLWFVIWLPDTRFPLLQEEVIRLRPLTLAIFLILFELIVFFRIVLNWRSISERFIWAKNIKRNLLAVVIGFLGFSGFFLLLKLISTSTLSSTFLFSSGPFIGPIQMLSGIVIFLAVFFASSKNETQKPRKLVWIGLLVLIGVVASIVWNFTPLSCADDRPGPFPPNNVCYPQVDDSVYSIGSHYVTLGKGVLNHWFTDKPFYMVFLAIGQWLFGETIDKYLIFQIFIVSLMPVFLFLIGRKFSGLAGGILAAYLVIVLEANNVFYYASAGGINVKIENTEILTGVLLVFCTYLVMKYLSHDWKWYLLSLSGGMLGLASLTRLTPLFVLPVLLIFFLATNWKRWRKFLTITGLFLFGFLMIFIPGMFSARDENGQFFYLQKIENVLDIRYQREQTTNISPDTNAVNPHLQAMTTNDDGTMQLVGYHAVSEPRYVFTSNSSADDGNNYFDSNNQNSTNRKKNLVNKLRLVVLTTTNNLFLSLARLPIHFSLHSIGQIIKLPGALTGQKLPLWQMKLTLENYVSLAINLLIFIAGIVYSFSRWKWTALLPLLVHFGYHLGNGAALTSGERYLEPVQWVTLLYFAVGVFAIVQSILNGYRVRTLPLEKQPHEAKLLNWHQRIGTKGWITIGVLVLLGGLLPLTNLLPDKIAARPQAELSKVIRSMLDQNSTLSKISLAKFLESEKAVIVEGIAYHPRQYDSPLVSREGEVFELTMLSEDKVYVSNYFGRNKGEYFTDGSRVVLLGCLVREKTFWGVETVILNTKGIMQLDNEKHIYFMNPGAFNCPDK